MYDDDDRTHWSRNDTIAEDFCWREWAGDGSNDTISRYRERWVNVTRARNATTRTRSAQNRSLSTPPPQNSSKKVPGEKGREEEDKGGDYWGGGEGFDDDYFSKSLEARLLQRDKKRYTPPLRPWPTPLGIPPSRLTLLSLLQEPITRTRVKLGGGREKYVLTNTSVFTRHTPVAVNIHGVYSQRSNQISLHPEDGYHLHFLNDDRREAMSLRLAAFFHHYSTKLQYNSSSGVAPPYPRNQEEKLFAEDIMGVSLEYSLRAASDKGGGTGKK